MSTTPPDAAVSGDPTPEPGEVAAAAELPPAVDAAVLGSNELVANSLSEYVQSLWKRVRSGDSGVLPVVAGLILIVIIFQAKNSHFLSAPNLTNLIQQSAVYVLLGMAEVFVLLLGEIDLSLGYLGAIGAVITVELTDSPHHVNWLLALLAGLAACAALGAIQGLLITRLKLPSFIVTLSGQLFFFGFLLWLIDKDKYASGGTITVENKVINDFIYGSLSPAAGWIVMIVAVALYALMSLLRDRRRRQNGLVAPPIALTLIKIGAVAAAGVVLVLICNQNRGRGVVVLRGMPWAVPIIGVILVVYSLLLGRTKYGRYLYAIGGNAEAARRAGISLNLIRLVAFILAAFTAGLAAVAQTSYLGSVSSNVNGGNLVLLAVASAVIGGTSLFGGHGRMVHAVLGGLVVAAIYNGMGLIGLGAAAQNMVTALVLLAAITVDAVARRGRTAA
jgi:D-xylose transport system permease protein